MSVLRVLVTTTATITKTIVAGESPTDATGNVTVTVKRLDGTAVASGTANHDGTGVYSFLLPASAVVDAWTVDWAATVGGAAIVLRDLVEQVGGFLFNLTAARVPAKAPTSMSTATLADKRTEVEYICEKICRRAWVPRFSRRVLDGTGIDTLTVPDMYLRTVRAVTVGGYGLTPYTYTADQLAAVAPSDEGVLYRVDGCVWPAGHRNITVEYEHGADMPPAEISTNAILHLRSILFQANSGIPERALSFTITDGGVYRLSLPGADSTGIPNIDAAYKRNAEPRVWIA